MKDATFYVLLNLRHVIWQISSDESIETTKLLALKEGLFVSSKSIEIVKSKNDVVSSIYLVGFECL